MHQFTMTWHGDDTDGWWCSFMDHGQEVKIEHFGDFGSVQESEIMWFAKNFHAQVVVVESRN